MGVPGKVNYIADGVPPEWTAVVIRRARKQPRILVFSTFRAADAWLTRSDWENRSWSSVEILAVEFPDGDDPTLDSDDTRSVAQLINAVRKLSSAQNGRLHKRTAHLVEKLDQAAWFTSVRFHDRITLLQEQMHADGDTAQDED